MAGIFSNVLTTMYLPSALVNSALLSIASDGH